MVTQASNNYRVYRIGTVDVAAKLLCLLTQTLETLSGFLGPEFLASVRRAHFAPLWHLQSHSTHSSSMTKVFGAEVLRPADTKVNLWYLA